MEPLPPLHRTPAPPASCPCERFTRLPLTCTLRVGPLRPPACFLSPPCVAQVLTSPLAIGCGHVKFMLMYPGNYGITRLGPAARARSRRLPRALAAALPRRTPLFPPAARARSRARSLPLACSLPRRRARSLAPAAPRRARAPAPRARACRTPTRARALPRSRRAFSLPLRLIEAAQRSSPAP